LRLRGCAGCWRRNRNVDDCFFAGFDDYVLGGGRAMDGKNAAVFVSVKNGDIRLLQGETIRARGQFHGVTTIRVRPDARDFSCDLVSDSDENARSRSA